MAENLAVDRLYMMDIFRFIKPLIWNNNPRLRFFFNMGDFIWTDLLPTRLNSNCIDSWIYRC